MMLADPFRMMTPPPFAMAPHVMVVPVAVISHFTPIRVTSVPFRMMHADPFRMILVPPAVVVPNMTIVPITIAATPIRMVPVPVGMMLADPFRMIFVPPPLVVPLMMRVPITVLIVLRIEIVFAIVIFRSRHRWRGREESRQCGGGE